MSMTFSDLQEEVKRRATRSESGSSYNTAVKNLINFSLIRISNEAPWRALRRKLTFKTKASYTTGTATFTEDSDSVTFAAANIITGGIEIGRRIKATGSGDSGTIFRLTAITGENAATINLNYDADTSAATTYKIYGKEIYNLPIQTSKPALLWHEHETYPTPLEFVTDRTFIESCYSYDDEDVPEAYMMWGEDWVIEQPKQASVISIVSSSASDTDVNVTIHGTVSGYPDYEIINSNGTSSVSGSKQFSNIERITKDASSVGRITCTDSSAATIAVLPVGDTTAGIMYKKIQLFPIPDDVYEIHCQYYKEPYRLVNDGDVHELGQDFDELIILLATAKLEGEQSKADLDKFFTLYKDELNILRRKNADRLDWLPRLQKASDSSSRNTRLHKYLSYSQVGSKFGRASWR